jgi:hypothetical protein
MDWLREADALMPPHAPVLNTVIFSGDTSNSKGDVWLGRRRPVGRQITPASSSS